MVQQFDYNPKQSMSPARAHYASELDKTRQKRIQLDENSMVGQVLGNVAKMGDDASAANVLQQIFGSNISPENKQILGKQLGEHYSKKEIERNKQSNQATDLSIPIKALDTLESLLGQSGIGRSGIANPSSNARYNRGQFEATQAALLPLFKSMFPRGMTEKEFKYINENYIPQASDTEQKIKGKIRGLRDLIGQQSGQGEGGGIPGSPEILGRSQNEKPQDDFVVIRNKNTGKSKRIPKNEYREHPLYEVMNQ